MNLIADEKIIFESPDPAEIYCFTPGICVGLPGKKGRNRLIAVCDFGGPGMKRMDGPRSPEGDYKDGNQLRIRYSDDGGETWEESKTILPFRHEILFKVGNCLYMIGNDRRLVISRSSDNGETWSSPAVLEDQHKWQGSCCSVDIHNGKIYIEYEHDLKGIPWPARIKPVLLAANVDADLTKPESWRFSEPFDPAHELDVLRTVGMIVWPQAGVLEGNVVRVYHPKNSIYVEGDRTVVLCCRIAGSLHNIGVFLMGHDEPDGRLTITKAIRRDDVQLFQAPLPGGNMKFHIQYDAKSNLYWMVASQTNGVDNERRRLGLYFSASLFDWSFAGLVAIGPCQGSARNYATLAIDGEDMFIVSRSSDERGKNEHDNNLQTFHRVRNFRDLVY